MVSDSLIPINKNFSRCAEVNYRGGVADWIVDGTPHNLLIKSNPIDFISY